MKKLICVLLIMFTILSLIGCKDENDPFVVKINEKYEISSTSRTVNSLVKLDDEFIGARTPIISKYFVAYAIKEEILIMCELEEDGKLSYWTFDLKAEEFKEYELLKDLKKQLDVDSVEWEKLWLEPEKWNEIIKVIG